MSSSINIIYVVDDDVSVGKALSLLLETHGFKVIVFTDASSFLEYKHLKSPACALLDINLPVTSGLKLQEQMNTLGLYIPVIFITGYGDIPKSVQAMKAGAINFFIKPFTEDTLLAAIAAAIIESKLRLKNDVVVAKIWKKIKTLSPCEDEIFRLVVSGLLNKQIASRRGSALQTIKVHRGRVMQKMQVHTVTELIDLAKKVGIPTVQTV